MALFGFLNELSMPHGDLAREVAAWRLGQLARSVRAIRRLRTDFALQIQDPIHCWHFGRNYSFDQFLGNPETKDDARVLLAAIDRAPPRPDLATRECDQALEYHFAGERAKALGLADLYDGLAISFDHPPWQATLIKVERTGLVEIDDGEVELAADTINVRNATTPIHVGLHRPWLDRAGKPLFVDIAEFDASRADRLTNIDFLELALGQLRTIKPTHPWWNAVFSRLDELQEAMAEWIPAVNPAPQWRSLVTGEGLQRRQLCNFVDLDGITRCFDEHARFTPGAGRLYFRLDAGNRRLIVAHIGRKL